MILSNIVFLDIDGVLNSLHCSDDIDEQKLPLLKRILDENNAQVVLSSTWRSLEGVDNPECQRLWSYLVDTLARYDISIVSKTPI